MLFLRIRSLFMSLLFLYTTLFRSFVPIDPVDLRPDEIVELEIRETGVDGAGSPELLRQIMRQPPHLEPGDAAALEERSEEHTSELQSPCNLVCRLLLEKKKIK